MEKALLIGAGGHGKIVIDNLRLAGVRIVGILDDAPGAVGNNVMGIEIVGRVDQLPEFAGRVDSVTIAVTDPKTRQRLARLCSDASLPTRGFIHPKAVVAKSARIFPSAQICAGAIVNPDAVVADQAIVNTGALIEHDCVVGDFCHIAPGVRLMGRVRIGALSMIGAAATIIQNLNVGECTVVAAGSVVVSDLAGDAVYMGIPAKQRSAK